MDGTNDRFRATIDGENDRFRATIEKRKAAQAVNSSFAGSDVITAYNHARVGCKRKRFEHLQARAIKQSEHNSRRVYWSTLLGGQNVCKCLLLVV